jgi:predicted ATP-dependent protease
MIRGGSLHQANGGILIVRAEDVASHPHTWRFLKAALRDKEIRIEELHRVSGIPLLAAPEPRAIPLDVQIILVGSPHWYYSFFYTDEEFQNYFKIKSDIDSTIAVTEKNLQILGSLLHQECLENLGIECEKSAISYVLSYGCRLANHRKKISARIDVLSDILKEAAVFAKTRKRIIIKQEDVLQALQGRHYRNSRFQDLEQEYLEEDLILIQTRGSAVGQINGLTVQSVGTETFGSPSRITARTYMGRNGIINIEHVVELSGPLQHKGVLSLEGFLRGVFGQLFPISFSATITFEQNYGGVEGDSASIAELMAILSSLSQIPLRQDIAITGSMNQMGVAQAIGGVNEKIEGFYNTCKRQGLTGTQGVIIPDANRFELVLLPEIAQAVRDEKFHIWTIKTVFEAVELLMGTPAGETSFMEESQFNHTIFGKVFQRLRYFDQELHKRYNFSQKEYVI